VSGSIVDTPAAEEFMTEILARLEPRDLTEIAALLEAKSTGFLSLLGEHRVAGIQPDELRRVLRSIFSCRRHADTLLAEVGPAKLAAGIETLLDGDGDVDERVDRFDALLAGFPGPGFDLPGELLHFTYPERYWLWTRWMWDPRTETGALRLVTADDADLVGQGRGGTYVMVGRAVAFVEETGKAVGFTAMGEGLLGIDVFLAAVYGVYMYTVLRMRMTQEFNRIVPPLPDLLHRLLGVRTLEV
jgi:hypothetical protein